MSLAEYRIGALEYEFVDGENREATWYMGWIYPGYSVVDEKLPEGTSLQCGLKKFLLDGNKFGIAK